MRSGEIAGQTNLLALDGTLAAAGTGAVRASIAGVADAAERTGASAGQVLSATFEPSHQSEHRDGEGRPFLETIRAA